MNRKIYDAPLVEVIEFSISCNIATASGFEIDDGSIENSGSDYSGDGDWDF